MARGDYHEAVWESLGSDLQPEHFAERLAFLLDHVKGGERVLDLGCGEGRFASELARAGARVTAADVAAEPLRRARALTEQLRTQLIGEAGPWPLADCSFDVVWAGEVIEHVADTAAWLSELRRVLRSGGLLLLSTPAHQRLRRLRLALSERAFAKHFEPTADHLRFYSRRTLTRLLADFGFEQITVRYIGGVPGARCVMLVSARRSRF